MNSQPHSHTIILTVTDNYGGSASDSVKVTVAPAPNAPPLADAGVDQSRTDNDGNGVESITLDASGSTDADGTIASYTWSENGSTIATGAAPTIGLSVGLHTITLTVVDDDGASDSDSVAITIAPDPNAPPAADAGPDQVVVDSDESGSENVTLDGSGSTDADGNIVSYEWTEGGNLIATGISPTLGLVVGVHNLTLTVTDAFGESDSATVTVTVNPNTPPEPVVIASDGFESRN